MISISDLKIIFDTAADLIRSHQYSNNHNTEEYENALNALYRATTETKYYISTFTKRNNGDREKERELSKLWYQAGVKLRSFNHDLAKRLIVKSDYWADPNDWTIGDLKESKISLDSIIKESRKLI